MDIKIFNQGNVIFREGEYEAVMYSIHSGKVGIYSNYGTKDETLLTTLGVDDVFGEMGLLDARPRSATAVALENVGITPIGNENFLEFFKSNPKMLLELMQKMSGRLRELSNGYIEACKTISEYVKADEENNPKKKSLLDKIKRFLVVDEEYRDDYVKAMQYMEMSCMHDSFNIFL